MNKRSFVIKSSLIFFILLFSSPLISFSKSSFVTHNLNGIPGILDMPSAGSFDDGQFSYTSSKFGPYLRNTISFQALPRIYGAFRYAGIGDRDTYYINSGYTTWDRSFDLRIDAFKEKKFFPEITVGFQDVVGTGNYSAEYLVASKSIMGLFRASAGLGWGRLSTQNQIVKNKSRPSEGGAFGGLLRYEQLFRGNVGVFGGLEYMTPLNGLKAKIELSSDSYEADSMFLKEASYNNISKLNYGLDYTINKNFNLSSYYIHGDKLGVQLNLSLNPNSTHAGDYLEPAPEPFYSLPYDDKTNIDNIWKKAKKVLLEEENIYSIGYKLEDREFIVFINNGYYTSDVQATGRTLRILSRFIPIEVNVFTVVICNIDIPISSISIDRNEVASFIDAPNAEILTSKISKISNSNVDYENVVLEKKSLIERSALSISPYYQLHLFDPDSPLYYDVGLKITGTSIIKPGVILRTTLKEPLLSTFDDIQRGPKGSLPKVRTNIKNYLNVSDTRIEELTVASYFKITKNLYGRIQGGLFETMYGGVSSEVMYYPIGSPLSVGAEINFVKPREYRQLLGFREIADMPDLNGHISAYWDTGFYNYHSQVDYGKYLAGDVGSTVTLTRKFPNGWDFGGFFTLTDASFSDFGEGSFDKGFFFRLPFNSMVPFETRAALFERIRPILGDGGAKVGIVGRLNEIIGPKRKNNLIKSWSKIWR